MGYGVKSPTRTLVKSVEIVEGETIETKVKRITEDNEPINDGAPIIFTERKDGVIAGYNIRTDRFEVACEAMDKVVASQIASSKAKMEVVKDEGKPEAPQSGASEGGSEGGNVGEP